MNYTQGVQQPITFLVLSSAGVAYTTSGSPPTLLVAKNNTAPAPAAGTLSHLGSGLWSYTPSVSEVAAPCWQLHLLWSLTGIQAGDVNVQMENDYTTARALNLDSIVPLSDAVPASFDTTFASAVVFSSNEGTVRITPAGRNPATESEAQSYFVAKNGIAPVRAIKIWQAGTTPGMGLLLHR
jgi:hypothetical protein